MRTNPTALKVYYRILQYPDKVVRIRIGCQIGGYPPDPDSFCQTRINPEVIPRIGSLPQIGSLQGLVYKHLPTFRGWNT